jgi:hypothetical protein
MFAKIPIISLISIFLALFAAKSNASRLPDTLRFGDIIYIKQAERLYLDEAKFIVINESGSYDFVMASLFKDHIEFFDSTGSLIKTDSLPGEPRFNFSKTGRWLFIWGKYDEQNNYYRLYEPGGVSAIDTIMTPEGYEPAFGIPLEKSQRFLKPGFPEVKLSLFDRSGNPLGGVSPLGYGATGQLFFADDLNEEYIFVTVTLDTISVFIRYNGNLAEKFRLAFPHKKVIALRCSPSGQYVLIRIIDEYNRQPMFVTDPNANSLFLIEYPRIVKFSGDEKYLAFSQADKKIIVVTTQTWEPVMALDIGTETDWTDLNFSKGENFLVAFDGAKIVLVDLNSLSWQVAQFPFAFFQAALINDAENLAFTGDFGWVVYKKIK